MHNQVPRPEQPADPDEGQPADPDEEQPADLDEGPLPLDTAPVTDRGPNGLAIGALVASICGGPGVGTVLGFVLGSVALAQIRRRGQKGSGLAVAALVVSGLTLVLGVLIATGVILDDVRDRIAGIRDTGTVELQAGDCISSLDGATRVGDMPVVSCGQPHKAEVYHVFELPAGAYPGRDAVAAESTTRCGTAFKPYKTPQNADLEIYYLYPQDEDDWQQDHSVLCIAAAPIERRTTSLLE
ncbi:DUF4190 domain-containing protein [Actinoplanes subglobosus]|uniref:DUF4190 domain-containing protein n=1 Tax=Actinoplanes subglobosus TaxID=1547892 RepID=A0ABV8J807_9ACTN